VSDPTNPKGVRWIHSKQIVSAADTIHVHIDDKTDTVHLTIGQSVGNVVVEIAAFVVQRDVAEAFGGSLLSLGNKPRPGE